jgi:hypothetical protein
MTLHKKHLFYLINILLIITLGFHGTIYAQQEAGKVKFLTGAVSAQSLTGQVRILQDRSPIYKGDRLTTGKKSYASIEFIDGSRLTLRPGTEFVVNDFNIEKNNESAVMELIKGGLRLITGFINKRDPQAYRIDTVVATIGIRGTELDARFCQEDCQAEAEQKRSGFTHASYLVVGRVALLNGTLRSTRKNGQSYVLTKGSPLYQGDRLITGSSSYAVLAFRDKGRITLKPDTEFLIEQMHYNPQVPEKGNAFFRLVKGGLRALTGIVGKVRQDAYKIGIPVATIGIRGTGFDIQCKGTCNYENKTASSLIQSFSLGQFMRSVLREANAAVPLDGAFVSVWNGQIAIIRSAGTSVLGQGDTVFIENQDAPLIEVPLIPDVLRERPDLRPDKVDFDYEALFSAAKIEGWPPGLYVNVRDGHVQLKQAVTGNILDLGRDEGAFVSAEDDRFIRMESGLELMDSDPYFNFNDESNKPVYSLISEDTLDTGFQCIVQ